MARTLYSVFFLVMATMGRHGDMLSQAGNSTTKNQGTLAHTSNIISWKNTTFYIVLLVNYTEENLPEFHPFTW